MDRLLIIYLDHLKAISTSNCNAHWQDKIGTNYKANWGFNYHLKLMIDIYSNQKFEFEERAICLK